MISKFKRTISGITAVAVISMSVPSYLSANIFNDALVSVNKQRSWNDSTSHNYYMGSVYVRFKQDTPPPIFNISAPEIQAGCSGINIKGMFVSILNLDQLANMLQNAGASLAWGVAIGLIYSLPGIANAFKMINAWAKRIQQILAAACQSGIVLGQMMANNMGWQKNSVDKWLTNHMPNAANFLQGGENAKLKAFGVNIGFDKNGVLDLSGADKMTPKDIKDALAKLLSGGLLNNASLLGGILTSMQNDSGGTFFTNLGVPKKLRAGKVVDGVSLYIDADNNVVTTNSSDFTVVKKGIGDLVNDSGIGDPNEQNKYKMMLLAYFFIKKGVGDIFINTDLDNLVKKLTSYLQNNNEKNQKDAADVQTNPGDYPMVLNIDAKPTDQAAKALANLIVNGISQKEAASDDAYTAQFQTADIVKMQAPSSDKYRDLVVLDKNQYQSSLSKDDVLGEWKGVYVAARCAASDILHIPVSDISLNAAKDNNKTDSKVISANESNNFDCNNTIYYVPDGFQKYEMTYMNTPVENRQKLQSALINYLSYHYAQDLLNSIESAVSSTMISKPSFNNVVGVLSKDTNSSSSSSSSSSTKSDSKDKKPAKNEKTKSPAGTNNPLTLISIMQKYSDKTNEFFTEVEKEVNKATLRNSKAISRDQLDGMFRTQRIINRERGISHVISQ